MPAEEDPTDCGSGLGAAREPKMVRAASDAPLEEAKRPRGASSISSSSPSTAACNAAGSGRLTVEELHCGADKVGAEVDGGVDESGSGGEEATVAATAIAAGRGDEEAGLNGGAGTGAVAAGAAGGRPVASVVDREAG
jgi:hypothetical protein